MASGLPDVLVIGGGIAGLSAGWRLAVAGASVTLLEAEAQCGSHSSGRSAAMLTENYGPPSVRALTAGSRAFLAAPPEGFCEAPLLRRRGSLTVARADQAAMFEAELAYARQYTPSIHAIDPADVQRLVPVMRPHAVAYAMMEPECCDIDAEALQAGYRRSLTGAGGRIVTGSPVTAIRREGGAWQVATPTGCFAAAAVVNAAGAWADGIATLAGVRPAGLQPKRRTAILVDAPGSAAWPMVNDLAEQLYFKPDAGRLMVSPADATPTEAGDAQADELDIAIAVDRLMAATTLEPRRVPHCWAGLRTFAADAAPVIGEDAEAPGFFWCAGQGGFGVMTSPALSALAAGAVLGQAVPAALSCQRPALLRAAGGPTPS